MRMFNADGSESEMCGNCTRCVGKYAYEKGLTTKKNVRIETLAGVLTGNTGRKVRVRLLGGELDIEWSEADNHIYMTGDAHVVFTGDYPGWPPPEGNHQE